MSPPLCVKLRGIPHWKLAKLRTVQPLEVTGATREDVDHRGRALRAIPLEDALVDAVVRRSAVVGVRRVALTESVVGVALVHWSRIASHHAGLVVDQVVRLDVVLGGGPRVDTLGEEVLAVGALRAGPVGFREVRQRGQNDRIVHRPRHGAVAELPSQERAARGGACVEWIENLDRGAAAGEAVREVACALLHRRHRGPGFNESALPAGVLECAEEKPAVLHNRSAEYPHASKTINLLAWSCKKDDSWAKRGRDGSANSW